jgi:hypothetical protein
MNPSPAPWKAVPTPGHQGACHHRVYDGEGKLVCFTRAVAPESAELPKLKANAAVIEAAPELLEACKAAIPRMIELDRYRAEREGRGPETVDFSEAIDGLRAAVAKAEGVSCPTK